MERSRQRRKIEAEKVGVDIEKNKSFGHGGPLIRFPCSPAKLCISTNLILQQPVPSTQASATRPSHQPARTSYRLAWLQSSHSPTAIARAQPANRISSRRHALPDLFFPPANPSQHPAIGPVWFFFVSPLDESTPPFLFPFPLLLQCWTKWQTRLSSCRGAPTRS